MEAIRTFFEMGGYAVYVWPAYVVTTIVMVGLLVNTLRFVRASEAELKTLQGEGRRSRSRVASDQEVRSEA